MFLRQIQVQMKLYELELLILSYSNQFIFFNQKWICFSIWWMSLFTKESNFNI